MKCDGDGRVLEKEGYVICEVDLGWWGRQPTAQTSRARSGIRSEERY